jgi:Methylase involved in ubiquinone/menaquinone biosynthesis
VTTLDYDSLAAEYARHRRTYPGLVEHIVDHAGLDGDSVVLEVGCGTANHLAAISQATGARCIGIEPSEQMLRAAAAQPAELDLRIGRAEELDFAERTFDLVLSVDVIHYVTEPRRYFEAAHRVLRPGGFLLTATDSEWLIRNRTPMAHYFPATIRAEATRYHPVPALAGQLALTGFEDLYERVIESDYQLTDAARFEEKAFSSLHLISDEEFNAGITALRSDLAKGPVTANLRTCALWGRRPR